MPGLYLRDKSNCLSLDQTSAFTPFCLIMCQDLSSQVSPHSNLALQHVVRQNTTDGLLINRPSHMECYKHDSTTHLQKYTQTDIQSNHTLETRLHTLTHKARVDSFKERLVSLCAVSNKTHSGITIAPIINAAIFVNIITDSSEQNKTSPTTKTPVWQSDLVKSQMKLKMFRWGSTYLQISLFVCRSRAL